MRTYNMYPNTSKLSKKSARNMVQTFSKKSMVL